jgi:hypothetical protein
MHERQSTEAAKRPTPFEEMEGRRLIANTRARETIHRKNKVSASADTGQNKCETHPDEKKGERGGKCHPRESTRPETYKESKVGANQLCRQHCGQPYGVSTSQEEKWDRAGPPDHV